jgi:NADH-quinone oxidoreductase subunit J
VLLGANVGTWITEHGALLVPLLLGAVAVWALLPKHRHRQLLLGTTAGLGALVLGGIILPQTTSADLPLSYDLLFYPFAGMAIVAGLLMIVQRNPVYSALWFAIVILNTCGLFLLQGGSFLAAATIIIYTGAIIVTFLFVMMLAQQTGTAAYDRRSREPFLATLAGFTLLGGLLYTLELTYLTPQRMMREIQSTIAKAQFRLEDDQARLQDVTEELRIDAGDGPKRALREMLETEADRYPGWPQREAVKKQIEQAVRDVGNARSQNDRAKMKEAVKLLAGLAKSIEKAGEHYTAKLAPPKEEYKLSPLSRMNPPPDKAAPAEPKKGTEFQPKPGHVTGIGKSLFGDYLYGVMLSAELLLVVTIGAIVITHRRKEAV